MRLPWRSRAKPSVGAAHVASRDSVSLEATTDASASPTGDGGHVQLHSRHSAVTATTRDGATPTLGDDDDPSGKAKPAPLSVKDATLGYLRHHWVSVVYSAVSLSTLVLMLYLSYFAAAMDDGSGSKPEFLSCRSWAFGTSCGLWGIDCRPFETDWTAIRCRSRCTLDQSSSLAVYGTGQYHANSRICRAAVHAGVIGANGGCALMRYAGPATAFHGSTANGVTTQNYLSWFPKTFEFKAAPSRYCTDLTWPILVVSVLFSAGFALLPRTNTAMLFHALVGWGFFYVRLVGQPPSVDYVGIVIDSFGEVFVLLAGSYWIYAIAPVHTFAQWATLSLRPRVLLWSVCYVVPFFVLLNMNMFEYVPWLSFDLGGYEDTNANAGTYIVIAVLLLVIVYCAFCFLRELYREDLWRRFVVWYVAVVAMVFLSWTLFNSTDFHLHHTMLGAFLIPLTRFPTPLAAAAQSALLGCFVQGYAAWGWSSYLDQKPTYLTINQPEAPIATNVTSTEASISWTPVDGVDGYSLSLNKVEVYRGTETNVAIGGLRPNLTYFITVAGVADWGTEGQSGPKANFTTLL